MYKSNIFTQKEEIFIYPPNKPFNLLSPSYNPRLKTKSYFDPNINNNIPKYRPLNLYSSCFSPFQTGKNLSVKNINSPDDKVSQNLLKKLSGNQKGTNSKTIGSPNTTNSDLLTAASLTSQQSNESFLSNNNNNVYMTSSFQPYNYDRNESNIGNRFNYSMIKPNMNFCNYSKCNNNIYINGNNINLNYYKGTQGFITQNQNNVRFKLNNKDNITNYNSNNSSNSNSSNSCKKSSSNKSINSNNKTKKGKINNNQRKKYFNKFNSSKENVTNENTVILTLKIKVAKNDIRYFHLKKYDDLFVSLEKFFDLNKISQSLIKPTVNKIFTALNKIFWLVNNKVGIYDLKYLRSLNKIWIKNNETLPKKNKDNSTISSSDSSDEKKHEKIKSNSFHDVNNLSEDDKDEKQKTSKSI